MAMKLFVWVDPYPVSYGTSMVFAVADNVTEAKRLAADSPGYAYGQYGNAPPKPELGEPTRVVDLPCAEWHEWSE